MILLGSAGFEFTCPSALLPQSTLSLQARRRTGTQGATLTAEAEQPSTEGAVALLGSAGLSFTFLSAAADYTVTAG